jgi:pyruvate kinase
METGMDVARLNFSHGTHEEQKVRLDAVKALRQELNRPVALMLDTKGPEIRLKTFKGGKAELKAGDSFTLTTKDCVGNSTRASVTYSDLPRDLKPGDKLLLDDGKISLTVTAIKATDIICEVDNDGSVSNKKSVNVPGVRISMPYISKVDYDDILYGIECGFDYIATSFTRTADDVKEVRMLLNWNGGEKIKIIAKIENFQGLEHFDEILSVADGVMVARGDLGVELPMEEIPVLQKKIIKKVFEQGKPVITATQMLESMMTAPRPTRAEATDVANAIYDGTSAIMLSGETAAGKYPVEALKTMVRLAEYTESDIDYFKLFQKREYNLHGSITHAISHAACTSAMELDAEAIVTFSLSGRAAQEVSAFRPGCAIIACTNSEKTFNQLSLNWGIRPLVVGNENSLDSLFANGVKTVENAGLCKPGDTLVLAAGVPTGVSGSTNFIKVTKA